jgi:hypothetical protein
MEINTSYKDLWNKRWVIAEGMIQIKEKQQSLYLLKMTIESENNWKLIGFIVFLIEKAQKLNNNTVLNLLINYGILKNFIT